MQGTQNTKLDRVSSNELEDFRAKITKRMKQLSVSMGRSKEQSTAINAIGIPFRFPLQFRCYSNPASGFEASPSSRRDLILRFQISGMGPRNGPANGPPPRPFHRCLGI